MVKLAPNTTEINKGHILKLYNVLFDDKSKFGILPNISNLRDYGLQEKENIRRIDVTYKNEIYPLEIYHYVRDNGNCLAVRNYNDGSRFIQLVFERFSTVIDDTFKIFHDGSITGTKGSSMPNNLKELRSSTENFNISDNLNQIDLGTLTSAYDFKDDNFINFISNFLIYSIDRKLLKSKLIGEDINTPQKKISFDFKSFIETLIETLNLTDKGNQYHFNTDVYTDHHIWISDLTQLLNSEQAHYEIILRNAERPLNNSGKKQICIDIHFEKNKSESNKIISELGVLPEKIRLIDWQEGNSLSYYQTYDIDDVDLIQKVISALEYIRVNLQENLINVINFLYNKIVVNKLFVNLTWNSNDWKAPSEDKSNHDWVKQGNVPMESWNFNKEASWNSDTLIYGNATFTNKPKLKGTSIFVFHSKNKIIGFYGDAYLCDIKVEENEKNLQGSRNLSFVLNNKIDDVKESGYFGNKLRIGQIGFNYINDDQTVFDILDKALQLNPLQSIEINLLKEWFANLKRFPKIEAPVMKHPLNQILYGPPGTGKTYTTIEKAIALANPGFNRKQQRAVVKAEYKRLCDAKQIEFITFHQSLSYEDFVEGIKPEIEEDKDGVRSVVYKINDGLFKTLANRARIIPIDEVNEKIYHFDDAWNALLELVQKSIENQQPFILDILTPKKGLQVTEITNNGNLRLTPKTTPGLEYTVSYSRLKELHKAIPNLSQVKNIDKEFRAVIGGMNSTTYWATLNFVNNWLKQLNKTKTHKLHTANVIPHVLIIDEINRGNVSQIFGELITLLEEDKREGEPEALEVTLPYSKERFSVPKNLYIIGTMNTADRSVEALDTALRRRFAFEEMLPNPYHEKIGDVEDVSLQNVLAVINKRLEKLLSRDHTIGHSFFINVTTEKQLYNAFYDKIIPLLQEYFFGDYGKIGLVLGKSFVEEVSKEKDFSFADFEYEEQDLLLEKRVYRINKFNNDGDDFLRAVKAIYAHT